MCAGAESKNASQINRINIVQNVPCPTQKAGRRQAGLLGRHAEADEIFLREAGRAGRGQGKVGRKAEV